jgi:2-phospho-L-lactate guanylyltransferase (CobY/MobA/RfbA family)
MLEDVVDAALGVGEVRVVTGDVEAADAARARGAAVVADPGGGQGAAVVAALEGLAGPALVVNADLPCATSQALTRLATCVPALVAARDGTTNALGLRDPDGFADHYGAGSAQRFAATGLVLVEIAELELDVDTLDDLELLTLPVGRRTASVLSRHRRLIESAT